MKRRMTLQRVLDWIRQHAKEHILLIAICALFFAFYRNLSGTTVALILVLVMAVWVIIMSLCSIGTAKMLQHERTHTLTKKRIVGYSFLVALPIYVAWAFFSLIPIVQYEVWLLTGFPICIFSCVALISLGEKWREMRFWFWITQAAIYLFLLVSGQIILQGTVV